MSGNIESTQELLQRYPSLSELRGRYYLVKYGGAAMERESTRDRVCQEIARLSQIGIRIVVVHGGGKEITRLLERLSIESRFINGVRVTSPDAMVATEMALSGSINKDLASRISSCGVRALGISGRDSRIIEAVSFQGAINEDSAASQDSAASEDFGETGDVSACNPKPLDTLLSAGFVPVVSPIGESADRKAKNLNADYAAAGLAGAMRVENCLFLTDVDGVRVGSDVLPRLTSSQVRDLISQGVITGGMIPKVQCAIRAIESGCQRATICNAATEDVVARALLGDSSIGTVIRSSGN